ncbi:TlpA family protein disulfide reductase [Aquimarina litoralis]|uniref:TlpA family protein disulfide reductase n=1 Tax=Aquimarina litoralis TaxID=584605 RepID=UPI001C593EE3|nr:TlpA disulfide reductase family protein [Aquimarina litoralis]
MKKLTLLLFTVLTTISINAQSTYYRNHKGDVLTEKELEEVEQKMVEKAQKINEKAVVEIEINNTSVSKDSIIHDFGFHVNLTGTSMTKSRLHSLKNKKLPYASLVGLSGDRLYTTELEGKPTLVNFWFTKCKPCIDEMPELNKLKKEYGDRINFVAITYESKEKVEAFLQKRDFNFIQVVDAQSYVDTLEIQAFPKNILLDKNGAISYIENGIPYIRDENGGMKIGEATELKNKLETLLK